VAELQRNPRDVIVATDAEYQRLSEKHRQYEVQLQNLSSSPYHNSEDLIEEIRLKKLKLHVKDEMERLLARHQVAPDRRSQ
jgi:uncharacterized protein YdcH (DUF465 family)